MRQSQLFPKTYKETPKDADNISAALLMRGGYVHKLMSGIFTMQPLGWRVMQKIEGIIRREMEGVGGQEIFMPALQPKELWERSGRWEKLKGDMYQFNDPSDRETGLAMTHEEVVVDLIGQQSLSYQDFPIKLFQFQDKFRYEPRAKSGVLRTREFIMKDLYSAHASEADLMEYYEKVKEAYKRIFAAAEVPAVVALASGGIFTPDFSHEFQSICDIGEDTVYVCPECEYAVNKEVLDKTGTQCPEHKVELVAHRAVEVGNIFKLGTKFSQDMNVLFTDADGEEKPFWFASYGIGLARLMGVAVEHHHDERGIIWPKAIAPFQVHLIDLTKEEGEKAQAEALYKQLTDAGVEVLFDDRTVSAGMKFGDADLLGMPIRLVISSKTLAQNSVERKERHSQEMTMVPVDQILHKIDKPQ